MAELSEVTSRECRFAFYSKSNEPGDYSDFHLIKEVIHTADGKSINNLRPVRNYKRPFYVTRKGLQNHNSKKEWEDIDRLTRFEAKQSDLQYAVAKALGKPWFKGSMRDLQASPYIYGTDISSTALIKQSYMNKWDTVTPYTNAVYDTETDVLHGTGEIMMATISFKEKVFTAVQKKFVAGQSDAINRVQKLIQKYLAETFATRKIVAEVVIVDSEIDVVKATINKAHEWRPDFLSVWNLTFDMGKVIDACERAGIKPEDILNDPSVPKQYRYFKFKIGAAKKTTASNKVMNYKPAQRWHSVNSPASFYWIDAMCAYHKVRAGSAEESSYALDAILNKHLNITKLKFAEADKYTGLAWHQFMQQYYPLEYIVYNMFDCISMEMLDEKTLDLQLSLPMFASCSDFENFNSLPKRTADKLHNFCLQNGKVIGSTASTMTEDYDKLTVGLADWIIMLPAERVMDNGLCVITENPTLRTNIRIATNDLDITGAYPTNEVVFNVSKETTRNELISIEGLDETTKRKCTMNLSGGHVNSVGIACTLFSLPTLDTLLTEFTKELQLS